MEEIKILKLVSGEDIICRFIKISTESYAVISPMVIGVRYKKSGATLSMAHWLPIEVIKKNETLLHPRDVVAMMEPNEDIAEYYDMTVDKLNDMMKSKFTPSEFGDLDEMEEIAEALKQSERQILH